MKPTRSSAAGTKPKAAKANKDNAAVRPTRPDVDVFIAEYLRDSNGKQSAITAGYSARSAETTASRLLRNGKVREAIDAHKAERLANVQRETGITLARTLTEISNVAYCQLDDIRGMGLDKTRALDMLMKHLGGYEANNAQAGEAAANALAGLTIRFIEAKS